MENTLLITLRRRKSWKILVNCQFKVSDTPSKDTVNVHLGHRRQGPTTHTSEGAPGEGTRTVGSGGDLWLKRRPRERSGLGMKQWHCGDVVQGPRGLPWRRRGPFQAPPRCTLRCLGSARPSSPLFSPSSSSCILTSFPSFLLLLL